MDPVSVRRMLITAVAIVAAACGRRTPVAPTAPDADCVVLPGAGAPVPVTLGLVGAVDPARAPIAATEAERLLFGQLYEPLVRRDCAGRLLPALAARWHSPDGGRRWVLTLGPAARFWNGQRVTAEDVVAAWGRSASPGATVRATDDSTVSVTFSEVLAEPWPLADPAFSVAAAAADAGGWPLGTTPPGRVRHVRSDDGRDLVDGGVDLVITRDPAVVSYARGLGGYDEIALPWDRVYVLLNGDAVLPEGPDGAQGFVAAVNTFAREPRGPFWWRALEACGYLSPRRWPATPVLYAPDDLVARDLAARVVAVSGVAGVRAAAGSSGGAPIRAVPRTPFRPCDLAREIGLTRETPSVRPLIETRAVLLVRRGTAAGVALDWDGMPRVTERGAR